MTIYSRTLNFAAGLNNPLMRYVLTTGPRPTAALRDVIEAALTVYLKSNGGRLE